jgi:large subunit ribosomal protein L9
MKVLLHADVPKLGFFGDVVDVKDGYARNYLLPQRIAVTPTEKNVRDIAEERARQADVRNLARQQLEKVAAAVDGVAITIDSLANEQGHLFGSVTDADIAKALQEKAFEVQAKQVVLPEHVRMLGTIDVQLRFAEDITATISLTVANLDGEESNEQPESQNQSESDEYIEDDADGQED